MKKSKKQYDQGDIVAASIVGAFVGVITFCIINDSIKPSKLDTAFYFNQDVYVAKGFYKGCFGKVTKFYKDTNEYRVEVNYCVNTNRITGDGSFLEKELDFDYAAPTDDWLKWKMSQFPEAFKK